MLHCRLLADNGWPIAAVRVQMHFSMNNHYCFSEAHMFGFSLQPSWRHIGLLSAGIVRPSHCLSN